MEVITIPVPGATKDRSVFVASDATGLTAERVMKAALVQFEPQVARIVRYAHVRSEEDVRQIVTRAAREKGVIVHTFVVPELRDAAHELGRQYQVDIIDIMGPLLKRLSTQLHVRPHLQPGLFRSIDEEYYKRIEAVDYTVKHDDGLNPQDLPLADIVVVGVSRTCKTPVSIFLAYRGWNVANVPIVAGVDPPRELAEVKPGCIVALTMEPETLVRVRGARLRRLGHRLPGHYNDYDRVVQELKEAQRIFARRRWPVVDVTNKSVEEVATEVTALLRRRRTA
jgi:hypothetical protein